MQVVFNDMVFPCHRAVKGTSYVRLYDENNVQTAAFEEVVDFSPFQIQGGQWEIGRSSQRVSAEASASGDSIVLTIKEKVIIETGLCVYFKAPVSSESVKYITVNGSRFTLTDSRATPIQLAGCYFGAETNLEIMLNTDGDNGIAYLNEGARLLDAVDDYTPVRGCHYYLATAEPKLHTIVEPKLAAGSGSGSSIMEIKAAGYMLEKVGTSSAPLCRDLSDCVYVDVYSGTVYVDLSSKPSIVTQLHIQVKYIIS